VFEDEPLPLESPLRDLDPDRVILTPHSIGNSRASQRTGTRMAVENILRALRGDVPEYVKNAGAIQRWRERFSGSVAVPDSRRER
jgi:D-3-phosphoglycerate dehydrogenase